MNQVVVPLNVCAEFLPRSTTAKHQTLDLNLIANSKIGSKSHLLRVMLDIIERIERGSSVEGRFRAQKVELARRAPSHVTDAMELFNEEWFMTSCASILNFW